MRTYRKCASKSARNKFSFFDQMKLLAENQSELTKTCDKDIINDIEEFEKSMLRNKPLEISGFEEEDVIIEECVDEKNSWTTAETTKLISVMKSFPSSSFSKMQMKWSQISKTLENFEVYKDPKDCARKWSNLNRTYRKCLPKYLETNILPLKFPYFSDIHGGNIELEWEVSEPQYRLVKAAVKQNSKWENEEIAALISEYNAFYRQYKDDELWDHISNSLHQEGIMRDPKECEIKMKQLVFECKAATSSGKLPEFHEELSQIIQNEFYENTLYPPVEVKEGTKDQMQEILITCDGVMDDEFNNVTWSDNETIQLIHLCKKYGEVYESTDGIRIK